MLYPVLGNVLFPKVCLTSQGGVLATRHPPLAERVDDLLILRVDVRLTACIPATA